MICLVFHKQKNIKSFLRHSEGLGGYMKYYNEKISYDERDGHYEIYVNGEFECSCDTGELTEMLAEVEKNLRNS